MATSEPSQTAAANATTRTALVVDDSMLIRHTVCRFMEARGYRVETATNGLEALDQLTRLTPNIIVTDLSMPHMTGSELITEIKTRRELDATPVIVLSAKVTASSYMDEMRADYVVYKDIDIEQQLDIALTTVTQKA